MFQFNPVSAAAIHSKVIEMINTHNIDYDLRTRLHFQFQRIYKLAYIGLLRIT